MAASHPGTCTTGRYDPEMWFPLPGQKDAIEAARDLCIACPRRWRCLADVLANPQRDGIWGGTTPDERKAINRETREDIERAAAKEGAREREGLATVPA